MDSGATEGLAGPTGLKEAIKSSSKDIFWQNK